MSIFPIEPSSTVDNRGGERVINIEIIDPNKQIKVNIATIEERIMKDMLFSFGENLLKKENYYITAVRNLIKKTNFLELYQQLLEKQITEAEFNHEIENKSIKYVINVKELQDPQDLKIIIDIVKKVGFDLKDFSLNEIDELFSVNISEKIPSSVP